MMYLDVPVEINAFDFVFIYFRIHKKQKQEWMLI